MKFSLQVVKQVIQQNLATNESVLCSPVSIDAILRILAVGAGDLTQCQLLTLVRHADVRELNAAASRLADVLTSSDDDNNSPEISYVNALWVDQRFPVKNAFQKVLKDVHNAEARVVDFINQGDQVVKEANEWAKKETKGLIDQIVTERNINAQTMMLLANALYFKGIWEKPFEVKNTKDDDFTLLDGNKVRIPFMNKCYKYFDYGTFKECQVLRMPYTSKKTVNFYVPRLPPTTTFSMYIFLPFQKDGLPNLMNNIEIDESMFANLDNVLITKLSIPKFKFESSVTLKDIMVQLGLTLPFDEDCADFSGMVDVNSVQPGQPLYVSDIAHKCTVETNEQGTEAAAVTMSYIIAAAPPPDSPPPQINFVAEHPFMFMIREDVSGAILFVGTMLNPKSQ